MKFLKTQNLSRYGIVDNALRVNPYGRYVMDGVGGLRLPKGTTSQRPQTSGISMPNGANGMLRYNTTNNTLECLIDGVWEIVRGAAATTITKQELGPGDYVETIFGPLARIPASKDNILVFVENVFQISDINFNLLYNYQGTGQVYIEFAEPVPLDKKITIYFGFAD